MRLFWLLFLLAWPIAAIVCLAVAPSMNWWFPSTKQPGDIGRDIDHLFNVIGLITIAIFLITNVALGRAIWKGSAKRDDEKGLYVHGNHKLEVIWTVIPLAILVFIAVYQTEAWASLKIQTQFPDQAVSPIAEVQARQFEWRIRYPGLDENGDPLPLMDEPQESDVWTVNELHVPNGRPVMIRLKSQDVQHSFYLPELRIKQDAVPGLNIPVWFQTSEEGDHVLMCAELCGWGHYKMSATVVAEKDDDAWLAWRRGFEERETDDGVEQPPAAAGDQGAGDRDQ